jgi:hypothetical protein
MARRSAAEYLGRLVDVQVAVEPEHEYGPLPRRQRDDSGPQIE